MSTFHIPTTAQIERVYAVEAENVAQAEARIRTFLKDEAALAEGIVTFHSSTDTTQQRLKPKSNLPKTEEPAGDAPPQPAE